MFPELSTFPDTTCAIAASTFADEVVWLSVSKFANCVRLATVVVCVVSQFTSINPGCVMASPTAAASLRASTCVLLNMYCVPFRFTSAPRVPPQQKRLDPLVLVSLMLLPDVPSATAPDCPF